MDLFDKKTLPSESPEPELDFKKAGLTAARQGSLSQMAKDLFFIAPALPYLHLEQLPIDLIRSFGAEKNVELDVTLCMSTRPFFDYSNFTDDVNNQYWAHSLVGLPKEYRDAYLSWVGSITFTNREEKTVYIVRVQPMQVHDVDLKTGFINPEIKVNISGLVLETNKYSLFYKANNGIYKAVKSTELVYDDTKQLAQRLFQEG